MFHLERENHIKKASVIGVSLVYRLKEKIPVKDKTLG